MALENFQFSFTPVSARLRSDAELAGDLSGPGGATGATRAAVAAIESHIANGDSLGSQGQYSGALNEYTLARAAIFQLLYPDFDASAYSRSTATSLPVSPDLETALLNASARTVDVMRPLTVPTPPVTRRFSTAAIPADLQLFTATGFREAVAADQGFQSAATQSAALLADQKPEAAADLLSDTLAQVTQGPASIDPGLRGALELNLSAAYLQSGNPAAAAAPANAAAGLFKSSGDVVGEAQAIYLSGISAIQQGNATPGQQQLQTAASLLKSAFPAAGSPAVGVAEDKLDAVSPPGLVIGSVSAASRAVSAADISGATAAVVQVPVTRDLAILDPIASMSSQSVTFRITGRVDGWGVLPVASPTLRREQGKAWQVGLPAGGVAASFTVAADQLAGTEGIIGQIYQPRVGAAQITALQIQIVDASGMAFYLPHFYAFVLPVRLGDTYNKLGQFARAEASYQQACGYTYLNQALEVPALWLRMAQNAVDWADTFYKAGDLTNAQAQYSKLVTAAGAVPDSLLYSTLALAGPAATAKTLIGTLAARPVPLTSGEMAIPILTAYSKLQQIAQGLDFYGLLLTPIQTFEYLQSVARGFAQEASQAEQQFMNYAMRQEAGEQTRRDLEATAAMAHADADSKYWQYQSALDDGKAAQAALDLANKRVTDAVAERSAYLSSSTAEIWAQAASQALEGGQDAMYNDISELADELARGQTISGSGPQLAAAQTLYAGRKTQAYELQKMQDNISELQQGVAAMPLSLV